MIQTGISRTAFRAACISKSDVPCFSRPRSGPRIKPGAQAPGMRIASAPAPQGRKKLAPHVARPCGTESWFAPAFRGLAPAATFSRRVRGCKGTRERTCCTIPAAGGTGVLARAQRGEGGSVAGWRSRGVCSRTVNWQRNAASRGDHSSKGEMDASIPGAAFACQASKGRDAWPTGIIATTISVPGRLGSRQVLAQATTGFTKGCVGERPAARPTAKERSRANPLAPTQPPTVNAHDSPAHDDQTQPLTPALPCAATPLDAQGSLRDATLARLFTSLPKRRVGGISR